MSGTLNVVLGGSLTLVLQPSPPAITPFITVTYGSFTVTAEATHMAYVLPSDMQVHVHISYVDAAGNLAKVDGGVVWDSSDEAICAVQADAQDTTNATIASIGPLGTVQINAIADADLGQGVRRLVTTLDVTIVAGEAVTGTISPVGDAEPVP